MRFWISHATGDHRPFGPATTRIVDEHGGGVMLYVHIETAPMVLQALRDAHPCDLTCGLCDESVNPEHYSTTKGAP